MCLCCSTDDCAAAGVILHWQCFPNGIVRSTVALLHFISLCNVKGIILHWAGSVAQLGVCMLYCCIACGFIHLLVGVLQMIV